MDVEGIVKMEDEQKKAKVMILPTLQEQARGTEAMEEHKVQEEQSETSMVTEQECMCDVFIMLLIWKESLAPCWFVFMMSL